MGDAVKLAVTASCAHSYLPNGEAPQVLSEMLGRGRMLDAQAAIVQGWRDHHWKMQFADNSTNHCACRALGLKSLIEVLVRSQ